MALFPDPFEALVRLQQTMDTLRSSDWLNTGPSAAGAFPPVNAFRKGDDYMLIAELPGVDRELGGYPGEGQHDPVVRS